MYISITIPKDDEKLNSLNLFTQDNLGEKNQNYNFNSWDKTLSNNENYNNISNIPFRIISQFDCSGYSNDDDNLGEKNQNYNFNSWDKTLSNNENYNPFRIISQFDCSGYSNDDCCEKNFSDFIDSSNIYFSNLSKKTEKNESFESNNINKENNEYRGIKTLIPPKENIFVLRDINENKKKAINKKRNRSKNKINNEINNIINEKENKSTEERNKIIKVKTFFSNEFGKFINKLLSEKKLGQLFSPEPYFKETTNIEENLNLMDTTFKTIYEETRVYYKYTKNESLENNRKIIKKIYDLKNEEIMFALNLTFEEAFKIFMRETEEIDENLQKKVSSLCPKMLKTEYFSSWKTFIHKLEKDLKGKGYNESFIKKYIYDKEEGIRTLSLNMKKWFETKKGREKKNNVIDVPSYLKKKR